MNNEEIENNEPDPAEVNDELYERFHFLIDKGQKPLRIDKFLITRMEGGTRNKLQQAITNGLVLINGKPVKQNYKIKPLDEVIIYADSSPHNTEVVPEKLDLNIIFEDDDLMIINKPAGLVVHPGSGNYSGTLLNGVAWHLQKNNPLISEESLPRFGLVHRIDKNTSGILVLAKNDKSMRHLAKQFYDHTVGREYTGLVWGDLETEQGTNIAHVGRNQRYRQLVAAYPGGEH